MKARDLPHYSLPFVGRSTEIADISSRLGDPNCRLLTLVGAGGIGKTRLAIEFAAHYAAQLTDAVYFVPLQPVDSPDVMVPAIAEVLGFRFNPAKDPRRQLLHYLHDLELLLVLDNLEHLLDGVTLLLEILEAAPGVSILATSRERLNLHQEWVLDVRELAYPTNESATNIESYDAVQLFLNHIRRINAHSDLNPPQRSAIVRICQLVGGMPLGIELAAAWARTLSYEGIAQGIESSLDILESSARDIEPRHRSIRATLEPMWNRLSATQRSIFGRLSIFRGSFSLEAAAYVTGTSVHTLSALVDRSLLHLNNKGRYDLHELLRQYAQERLHESPDEWKATAQRHCQYYAGFLERRKQDLEGTGQQQALAEIQREIDNIRAAWHWAVEHKRASEIDRACHSLWFFYDTRSWYQEAFLIFGAAAGALGMDQPGRSQNRILGKLMAYYGATCYSLPTPDGGQEVLEKSLTMLRHLNARPEIGFALLKLAEVALFREYDLETAQDYLRESLVIFRQSGNHWGTAYSLRWLSMASIYRDDYEEALRMGEMSLAIHDERGDSWGRALTLGIIAICALQDGHYHRAKQISQEIVTLCETIGLRWHRPSAFVIFGSAACGLGDYDQARHYLRKGLEDALEIPVVPIVLFGLLESVPWLVAMGAKSRALEILSFLLAYATPPVRGKRPVSRLIAELTQELPDSATKMAMERGKSLTLDAVTEACVDLLTHGTTSPQKENLLVDRLTKRELDVLRLAATGLTNAQIAAQLVITVGTVKWYLHHIYKKLDVSNRTQATARGRELHLLP